MKKLSVYLFLLAFAFLPLKVLAAVDITLEDNSTTSQKSVDILVNTGTDTTEKIAFQIQASEGVTVSALSDDNTVCSSFSYTNVSNLLTITCTLAEAKVLNGNVATILFAPNSADYAFTVSKTTGLDLGSLTLGTVTDITSTEPEPTTEIPTATTPTVTETETTKSFQDILTDYLPYILIGGATILLISILGILLSKKKDGKPEEVVTQVEENKEEVPAPSESRPTDIDNISGNLYTPQVKEGTIQEKLEQEPVQLQSVEAPSEATESNDLADLMAKDNSQAQAAPAPDFNAMPVETPTPAVEETTPIPNFNTMPVETPAPVIEETVPTPDFNTMPVETPPPVVEETAPVLPSNLPDMQQMVNNWAAAPKEETTPTDEPQSVPPVQPTI
ncbi:MAG TPA: hypothetical protein PKW94_00205 [Candidatus Dojkabacteria bacterium]|nr:hypothetical protein [Candidatus Dojkabacteria bacterium]HOR05884.1 hypothetical protein [Candidatus Dojkabacteria bacterium]HOT60718.1 hypothetical protein [Candidatus Dojkabacteria bacterium]HQI92401.1 hypothetical protein [Candidatus Dojkabacteria bacterium]